MTDGRNDFFSRLRTEYGFRTAVFAAASLIATLAFAVYNGTVGILNGSVWFGALAAYYLLLTLLRGGVLLYRVRRKTETEEQNLYARDRKVYGLCGFALLLLPAALSFAVLQMVRENAAFVHRGLTIYAYAVYVFYKAAAAIRHCVKIRKTREMTLRALRNISLADALASVLALQTAMFREFGTGGGYEPAMNAITGAAVCALTALIGLTMAATALKERTRT